MSSRISILAIPPEIRLMIFREYFAVPGGYALDAYSAKLRTASGDLIDLSLRFTCTLLAKETIGIPFLANTINFSTVSSNYISSAAGRLDLYMRDLFEAEDCFFWDSQRLIDKEVRDAVVQKFPGFREIMDSILKSNANGTRVNPDRYRVSLDDCGLVASMRRSAMTYTLHLLRQRYGIKLDDECFLNQNLYNNYLRQDIMRLPEVTHEPWSIPSWNRLNQMAAILGEYDSRKHQLFKAGYFIKKYRFSATAAAIFFLKSIPDYLRRNIRHIVLHENHASAAYPECHAQGLIPFFKENPHLRIKRRVNVWRAIFEGRCRHFLATEKSISMDDPDYFQSSDVCYLLAKWIMEVYALIPAGMPANRMVVILDAEPAPELFSEIFQQVVQRACWMLRMGMTYSDTVPLRPAMCAWPFDSFVDFPTAVERLRDRESIIQCNFEIGESWGTDEISKQDENGRFMIPSRFEDEPRVATWTYLLVNDFWLVYYNEEYEDNIVYFSRPILILGGAFDYI